MKKFSQLICLAALGAATFTQGYAAELVTPPFLEPQEEWVLTYDSYKSNVDSSIPRNLSRDISVVRDNDNLYFKGIFPDYPESWIMGTVSDDKLLFQDCQIIAVDGEKNEYFHCGQVLFAWADGITFIYESAEFNPSELAFKASEDGKSFIVVNAYVELQQNYGSFWYSDNDEGKVYFWLDKTWPFEQGIGDPTISGTGFPDVDYMTFMELHNKEESGIVGIGPDSADDSVAPMYDLQGRTVNPDTARPGIYIRNGRKIVIR